MINQDQFNNDIADEIRQKRESGEPVEARLSTSERILARVTDGIYRQPSSALRELIANAYDADATEVHILTDAPRFNKIIVRDNGLGLSANVLAYVIKSIGGSAKRTINGETLGVSAQGAPEKSPSGRKFIGKIGIGLFSVSQLTQHFQIFTKVKGEKYRTYADIILHTHTEDHIAENANKHEFKTGTVKIWSIPAEDIDSQGTEIVLVDIKNSAREILQSRERWFSINEDNVLDDDVANEEPPQFHIGYYINNSEQKINVPPNLPWKETDEPKVKFMELTEAVSNKLGGITNPKLEKVFDNYLSTIWSLSLAVPLKYIDIHPFEISSQDSVEIFKLSNSPKGHSSPIKLDKNQTIRDSLELGAGVQDVPLPFNVYVDGIKLYRPIKYRNLPETRNALKNPLMMLGKCNPDLSGIPDEYRGGNLKFEAYLFWTPKVIPRDHAGVLIRIHEASGTLFDETFMRYQVSEQTRLKQITAEIFIKEGLDSALNIDRESFNYSHPHYQYIKKWLHSALRQLATTQKRLSREIRERDRAAVVRAQRSGIKKAVEDIWLRKKGLDESPPEVIFADKGKPLKITDISDIVYTKEEIFPQKTEIRRTATTDAEDKKLEEQIKALASLFIAFGLFEDLSTKKQQELLREVVRIFTMELSND